MESRKYEIAGCVVELRIPFPYWEQDQFLPFRCEGEPDIITEFRVCQEPPTDKGELTHCSDIAVFQKGNRVCIEHLLSVRLKPYAWLFWDRRKPERMECLILEEDVKLCGNMGHLFQLMRLEQVCITLQTVLLHTSFIKWKEKGILFTAPSGTGKSTQADLWKKTEGAEIINGDRAVIRKVGSLWKAYGLPYAGSSQIFRNDSAVIKAIVVLRQGKKNQLTRLRPAEAFKWIYSETVVRSWDDSFRKRIVDLLSELVVNVPVWKLYCLPGKEAVELLQNELERS